MEMIKKIFLTSAIVSMALSLAISAEIASAAYYDCNYVYHTGDPRPGECYVMPRPSEPSGGYNTATPSDGYSSGYNTATPSGSYSGGYTTATPSGSYSGGYNTATPSGSYSDGYNTATPSGSYTNDTPALGALGEDPGYYKPFETRNERRYCVRDYCYLLYDYCYDDIHCEERVERIPQSEYEDVVEEATTVENNYYEENNYTEDNTRNYNYWVQYYIYNYLYEDKYKLNPHRRGCDYRYNKDCVYRGTRFGGYFNNYWHY